MVRPSESNMFFMLHLLPAMSLGGTSKNGEYYAADFPFEYLGAGAPTTLLWVVFAFTLLLLVLLVLLFINLHMYRRAAKSEARLDLFLANQEFFDIGEVNLKKQRVRSKGNWVHMKKLFPELDQGPEMTFSEMGLLLGEDSALVFRKMVDDMQAAGIDHKSYVKKFSRNDREIFLRQSIFLQNKDSFLFFSLDVTNDVKERAALQEVADRDFLTGLYRRKPFTSLSTSLHEKYPDECYIAIADIDFFKQINDSFGHEVGDIFIRKIAETLDEMLSGIGYCSRWGGEEFVVCVRCVNMKDFVSALERVRRRVEELVITVDSDTKKEVSATLTFGATKWDPSIDLRDAVSEADTALYEAKRAGRNRVFIYRGTQTI